MGEAHVGEGTRVIHSLEADPADGVGVAEVGRRRRSIFGGSSGEQRPSSVHRLNGRPRDALSAGVRQGLNRGRGGGLPVVCWQGNADTAVPVQQAYRALAAGAS